ncbi:hypothetical protein BH11PSE9_BH11PSE9_21750 [soil metagenome]
MTTDNNNHNPLLTDPCTADSAFDLWCRAQLQTTAQLSSPRTASRSAATTRDGATAAAPAEAASTGFDAQTFAEADVLAVHFADGSIFYTEPGDFAQRQGASSVSRSGGGAGAADARVQLPFQLASAGGMTEAPASRAGGGNGSNNGSNGSSGDIDHYDLLRLDERDGSTMLDELYSAAAKVDDALSRVFGGGKANARLAAPLAVKICAAFESAQLQKGVQGQAGGLLEWSAAGWRMTSAQAPGTDAAASTATNRQASPVLLFLHGTASSTHGSFGKLWRQRPGSQEVAPDFLAACGHYGRVLAWEHRSLTVSPIANVIGLLAHLNALPDGTAIDLVSHSRGGMIGELLALTTMEPAAFARARRNFSQVFPLTKDGNHLPDAAIIQPMFDGLAALAQRRVSVRTFVRVACPARGTLLADRRTDLFLSLMLRSIGLAFGGDASPVYQRFQGLVKALVAARADARSLPGLQAMVPGSELTRALNASLVDPADADVKQAAPNNAVFDKYRARDRLRVIAGDSEGKGWGGIVTLLGDVFFGLHDHDFVVHTRSMFGGWPRASTAPALSLRVDGAQVTHFSYFGEADSRQALFAALALRDDGFSPIADDEARTRGYLQIFSDGQWSRTPPADALEALRKAPSTRRAVVVMLPGIMGSELSERQVGNAAGERIWLDPGAVRSGEIKAIGGERRQDLIASGLVPMSYERLLKRARRDFHVIAMPYDWRLGIGDAAAALHALLLQIEAIAAPRQAPVHVIAHSMGGLVARHLFFGDEPVKAKTAPNGQPSGRALWASLKARGSRLLMLGTPNAGSYAPVRAVLQQDTLCNSLGVLAQDVSVADVARWSAGFEGLMQMLPQARDPAYGHLFEPGAWATMGVSQPPAAVLLRQAADFREQLDRHWEALRNDPNVLYVAGLGLTDVGLAAPGTQWSANAAAAGSGSGLVASSGIGFRREWTGDGTVSWDSTLRPERTWYTRTGHGWLADDTSAFEAYFELLANGSTARLSQQKPVARSGNVAQRGPLPQLPSLPDEGQLAAYVLGMNAPPPGEVIRIEPIEVRIVHGSLDYARYPLIVGHYMNDKLVSAERRVDEKLGGQLQELMELNLYPGAQKTNVYVRPNPHSAERPAYPGAIIVGLGNVDQLSPASLAETVTRAVLRYAFEHRNRDAFSDPNEPLRLSTLLVGTHAQAMTLRQSLAGVMQGVWHAARLLAGPPAVQVPIRIAELEIIEMWEHKALDASYGLQELLRREEWRSRFVWKRALLEERDGGLTGYQSQTDRDWWQSLCVTSNEFGGLNYALIAETARVESTRVHSDIASMSSFMDAVSDGGPQSRADDPAMSRILFELLLPNDLKSRVASFDNTLLVLDDQTSMYPWELIAPPQPLEDTGADEIKPLAIQAGLIRQRYAEDFRRLPQASREPNVLVVGNPSTEGWLNDQGRALQFDNLPGAEGEAARVAEMLRADQRDWRVTSLIGPQHRFDNIRLELLARPYRILHLGGHGVVDWWLRDVNIGAIKVPQKKTGMVLSGQQLLTAGDVEQMSSVPDLVFINCCYSGRDGNADLPTARRFPVLAASLALQFIKMGAKAVVAAGWQVDDAAAKLFSESFYQAMLSGKAFGAAVKDARNAVYETHGRNNNTWGAYQCYGDPDWTLEGRETRNNPFEGSSKLVSAAKAMSHREVASLINQVVAVAGDKPAAALLQQLDQLVAQLRADPARSGWLRSSSVRASLGEAYRELGDNRQAVEWWCLAAHEAGSKMQLRQIELLVNSLSREGEYEKALTMIHWLNQGRDKVPAGSGRAAAHREPRSAPAVALQLTGTAHSERECLEGSINLREAFDAADPAAAGDLLAQAALKFASGFAAKRVLGDFADRKVFALSNFLLCSALATLNQDEWAPSFDTLIAIASVETTATLAALPWHRAADEGESAPSKPFGQWQGEDWLAAADSLLGELRNRSGVRTFWDYTNTLELSIARCLFADVLGLTSDRAASPATRARHAQQRLAEARQLPDDSRRSVDLLLVRWPSPRELASITSRFESLQKTLLDVRDGINPARAQLVCAQMLIDITGSALQKFGTHRPGGR